MNEARLSPLFSWRSALCDSDLPPDARHVGLTLSLHMNERGGSCFPALETLREETGRRKATVIAMLTLLKDRGWLSVKKGGGRGHPNVYTAVIPKGTQAEPFPEPQTVPEPSGNGTHAEPVGRKALRTYPLAPIRARDEVFEALQAIDGSTGELTKTQRGRLNKAAKELRDIGASPDEIRARAANWSRRFPQATCTALAVVAHWGELNGRPGRKTGLAATLELEERYG